MAKTRAISSFSYVDFVREVFASALLKRAMGLLSWNKTTTNPFPEVLHSMEKDLE